MKKILLFVLLIFSFNTQILSANDNFDTNNNAFMSDFSDEFTQPKKEQFDPLSGYNRVMTTFNDKFYIYILNPTAKGYKQVVPEMARVGISNFFNNITFPIRFINNILQLKFSNAFEEVGRFTVNSTIGILGFMDPAASELGWEKHNEDFGQTLGFYGAGEGFHIVLPFFGPSNLRDTVGLVADAFINPIDNTGSLEYKIPKSSTQTYLIKGYDTINDTSLNIGKYESLKKDAIDLYPFIKDVYNQNRERLIKE